MPEFKIKTWKGPAGWFARLFTDEKPGANIYGPFENENEAAGAVYIDLEKAIAALVAADLGLA